MLMYNFTDDTLKKIYGYILHNPDSDLKLKSISTKFFLNQTYLSNLFSRKSNIRYSQLITNIKLKRAEYLITYEHKNIADVAIELGYKDLSYFNKLYQKIIGVVPESYNQNDSFSYTI